MAAPQAQLDALAAAEGAWSQVAAVREKIRSGDLRGAQARIGFALRRLGDCVEEINAAMATANEAGFLPPVPKEEDPRALLEGGG